MLFKNLNFMHPPNPHTYWSHPIHGLHVSTKPTKHVITHDYQWGACWHILDILPNLRAIVVWGHAWAHPWIACFHPLYFQVSKLINSLECCARMQYGYFNINFLQRKLKANYNSSRDQFLFVIRLELVLLVGASSEIGIKLGWDRFPQKKISFGKGMIRHG